MIDLKQILIIAVCSLVIANFFAALAATIHWRRTYYAARAAYRSMTSEDWRVIKAGLDVFTVAVGLAAIV